MSWFIAEACTKLAHSAAFRRIPATHWEAISKERLSDQIDWLLQYDWSVRQVGGGIDWMTFTFSEVLSPLLSSALNVKRTSLYYLRAWLYCQTVTFCTDTHCSLRQSIVQLVALETLNDTHPAHKAKFMNPPCSLKMAISTEEQMCYFTWYLRIPVLVGGLTPHILKSRSGCSTEPNSSPHPNTTPWPTKTTPGRGSGEGEMLSRW